MTTILCSIEGCPRKAHARGWCSTHYGRWRRTGEVGAASPVQQHHTSPEAAFAARTTTQGECLVWTGAKNSAGYGQIWTGHEHVLAHRYAWEQEHGPVPDGMVVDHLCHTPLCVKASHLRAVTQAVNVPHRIRANSNSTTGVRNVHPHKGSYTVRIMVDRKMRRFGTFATIEEAEAVAIQKRAELFGENPREPRTA